MVRNFTPDAVSGPMPKRNLGSATDLSKVPEHIRKGDVPRRGSRHGSRGFGRSSPFSGAAESKLVAGRWSELERDRDTGADVLQSVSSVLSSTLLLIPSSGLIGVAVAANTGIDLH